MRKMQIKTIMRYHLTPVRTATIKINNNNKIKRKKTENNKCCQRCRKIGILMHCFCGSKISAAIMENSTEVPQKIKSRGLAEWLKW
jgi:hypothetical protein